MFSLPLDIDPRQVIVDGKAIYHKIDKVAEYKWELGKLTDGDNGFYQYDVAGKRLLINVGGELAGHIIRVPLRRMALNVRSFTRVLLGAGPGAGQLLLDDVTLKVQ